MEYNSFSYFTKSHRCFVDYTAYSFGSFSDVIWMLTYHYS